MKIFLLLIIVFVFYSCGSSPSNYIALQQLSDNTAFSKTSKLYVKLPKGWFVAEENDCNCTELWIVKHDYSESITFKKINVDEETKKNISENKIQLIAGYNKIFLQTKFGKANIEFIDEKPFELNGNLFSAYTYKNPSEQIIRVVVFKHDDNIMESEAVSKNGSNSDELFMIQNAVLSTLN